MNEKDALWAKHQRIRLWIGASIFAIFFGVWFVFGFGYALLALGVGLFVGAMAEMDMKS